MAQFDVYPNTNSDTVDIFPYLLDVTHQLHSISRLRVVVPLCSHQDSISGLNPVFDIKGQKLYMSTMHIAGIPASLCVNPVVNISDRSSEIINAIDFLLTGF